MPIYELFCPTCELNEERLYQSHQAYEQDKRACPRCETGTLERTFSTFAIGNTHKSTASGYIVRELLLGPVPFGHVQSGKLTIDGITMLVLRQIRKDPSCN